MKDHTNQMMNFTINDIEKYANEIIQGTACTLEHIRDVNDWKSKPESLTFVGKDIPDLGIVDYCHRLQKYFRCSPSVSLGALIYIDRFVNCSDVTINRLTIHRLLIVAFTISVKYFEDLHFSNSYYAQVGGVDLKELNRLEAFMLSAMQFNLHISETEFQQYFSELAMHPQMCPSCRGVQVSSGKDESGKTEAPCKESGKESGYKDCRKDSHTEHEKEEESDCNFAKKYKGMDYDHDGSLVLPNSDYKIDSDVFNYADMMNMATAS